MSPADLFTLKASPGPGLCPVKGCRHRKGRKKGLCDKHHQQLWRARNPKDAAYATLKMHAKQRGIEFRLSVEYFAGLTDAYRFFDRETTSHGETLSIDRIDPAKGYVPGNLRVVTVSENVIKGNRERYLPEHVQAILERKRSAAWAMAADPEPF